MNARYGKKRARTLSEEQQGHLSPLVQHDGEHQITQMSPRWWSDTDFWTASGTVLLAAFTLVLVVVGALQYSILKRSDATLRANERAYISPDHLQLVVAPRRDPKTDQLRWSVIPYWANTGNTPSTDLTLYSAFDVTTTNRTGAIAPTYYAPPNMKNTNVIHVFIGPHEVKRANDYTFRHNDNSIHGK